MLAAITGLIAVTRLVTVTGLITTTNPGDKEAEAKFKEATEAYSILSDPDKRRQYDQFGHAAFETEAVAERAASAALISPDPIWGIFSEISSETCLEAAEAADVPIMDL